MRTKVSNKIPIAKIQQSIQKSMDGGELIYETTMNFFIPGALFVLLARTRLNTFHWFFTTAVTV